jgi:hypothetical protein
VLRGGWGVCFPGLQSGCYPIVEKTGRSVPPQSSLHGPPHESRNRAFVQFTCCIEVGDSMSITIYLLLHKLQEAPGISKAC